MNVFNKCCFCIPLRTGCFIVGYLQLVGAAIGIATSIGLMITGVGSIDSPDEKEAKAAGFVIGMSATTLVLFLLAVPFCIVLLVGLHKSQPKLIKVYMIYAVVFLVMYFFTLLLHIFVVWEYSSGVALEATPKLGLSTYVLLVIRSYYLKLKEEQGLELLKLENDSDA